MLGCLLKTSQRLTELHSSMPSCLSVFARPLWIGLISKINSVPHFIRLRPSILDPLSASNFLCNELENISGSEARNPSPRLVPRTEKLAHSSHHCIRACLAEKHLDSTPSRPYVLLKVLRMRGIVPRERRLFESQVSSFFRLIIGCERFQSVLLKIAPLEERQ